MKHNSPIGEKDFFKWIGSGRKVLSYTGSVAAEQRDRHRTTKVNFDEHFHAYSIEEQNDEYIVICTD